MKTTIIYGSMTGTTNGVADDLANLFDDATVIEASSAKPNDLAGTDLLILGASTWGEGDLQDDMIRFLENFEAWNITASAGAVFGLGDQFGYGETYVDGMADMADALRAKGLNPIGATSTVGYSHGASRAQNGDHFIGLALDEDNEADQTAPRLSAWVNDLTAHYA